MLYISHALNKEFFSKFIEYFSSSVAQTLARMWLRWIFVKRALWQMTEKPIDCARFSKQLAWFCLRTSQEKFYLSIRFSRIPWFRILSYFSDVSCRFHFKFVFEFRICSRKILRDALSVIKMTFNTFSVIRSSRENLWDYEQNDGFDFRYTDATFKFKMPEFTNYLGLSRYIPVTSPTLFWYFRSFSNFFVVEVSDLKRL